MDRQTLPHMRTPTHTHTHTLLYYNFQCRKLTLQKMDWHIFPPDNMESTLPAFMAELKTSLSGEAPKDASAKDETPVTNRRQLYAHSKQQSKFEQVDEQGNFWDRNFGSEEEVAWFKFQQAFLTEYNTNISESFDDSQVTWLLDMLKNDVFEVSEVQKVTKVKFLEVRGESERKGQFWKVVSEIATEKYCMNEVFNMESSVRLTAVENLGKFIHTYIHTYIHTCNTFTPQIKGIYRDT